MCSSKLDCLGHEAHTLQNAKSILIHHNRLRGNMKMTKKAQPMEPRRCITKHLFFQFTRQAKSSLGKTLLDSGCIPSVKSGTNRQTLTQNMKYVRAGNQTLMLELEPMSMFGSSLPSLVCGLTSSRKSYLQLMFAYICKYLTNILYIFAVALCSKVCGCYLVRFSCHPTSN